MLWFGVLNKLLWSFRKHISSINADLASIQYPNTTSRPPRGLTKIVKLKANESRILLLIVYPIFKKYLPITYYSHLQMMAFGITTGESHNISSKAIDDMEILLTSFVDNFPYPERYIVQNIHAVKHFATTVRDFSPLFNYSTFNFESVISRITLKLCCSSKAFISLNIGCLSASIHGTKRLGRELVNNIHLFKQAYIAYKNQCSSSYLSPLFDYLCNNSKPYHEEKIFIETVSEENLNLLYKMIPKNSEIQSMKSSKK